MNRTTAVDQLASHMQGLIDDDYRRKQQEKKDKELEQINKNGQAGQYAPRRDLGST